LSRPECLQEESPEHSHGLRRLAAVEAARGSYTDAAAAIERATTVRIGKRQVVPEEAPEAAQLRYSFHHARTAAGAELSPADFRVIGKRATIVVYRADGTSFEI
jgi:hypothetical protein